MFPNNKIEDSPQISVIIDIKTNQVADANGEALKLWGFDEKSGILGTSFPRLVHFEKNVGSAQGENALPKFAFVSLPDGMQMRVRLFYRALEADENLLWVNILPLEELDIREFPKNTGMFSTMQRQLHERNEYKRILDAAPVGIMLVDETYAVRKLNRQMCTLLDRDFTEAGHETFGRLFDCSFAGEGKACGQAEKCRECRFRTSLDNVLSGKEPVYDMEVELSLCRGGKDEIRCFRMNMVPLHLEEAHYAVVSADDMTNRQSLRNKLETLSMTDELTGISNRRGAVEFLRRSVDDMIANSSRLSLALIDLDDFKTMNDTYSHGFGDEVIRSTSDLISELIRTGDFISRYGGDEFLMLFPHTDAAQAKRILERVRQELKKKRIGNLNLQLSFSGGILEIDAAKAREYSLDALIHSADVLLYKAKGEGKDKILTDTL